MLLLALYIVVDCQGGALLGYGPRAEDSILGIVTAGISAMLMPSIGMAKLRIAKAIDSASLRVDAYESITCASLAVTTLIGLLLNYWQHWWWADPAAGLLLLPLIIREGLRGTRTVAVIAITELNTIMVTVITVEALADSRDGAEKEPNRLKTVFLKPQGPIFRHCNGSFTRK